MTPYAADTALFDQVLVHEDQRAAAFQPGAIDRAVAAAATAQAERLLAALAHGEGVRNDDADDLAETASAVQRVEAKLDLLLGLFGVLMRERGHLPAPTRLRWSTRGARLDTDERTAPVADGTPGLLRLQPAEWLPDCIELPAQVMAGEPGRLWVRFDPLPAGLADALERHLFRMHRRQVAESRRQR